MMKSERCFSRPVESVVFALREFLHLLTVVTFAIGAPGMVSPACDPPPLYLRFCSRPVGLYYLSLSCEVAVDVLLPVFLYNSVAW